MNPSLRINSQMKKTLLRRAVALRLLPFGSAARLVRRRNLRKWKDGVPATFTEKVQYKVLHDRRELARIFSDRLAVRDYVFRLAPELNQPRLLGVFKSERELAGAIPIAPWVMKASHGSGMVLISKISAPAAPALVHAKAREWLNTEYAYFNWEWQYLDLPRRIVFEEYLGTEKNPPADYKLFVINQKVRLITVDEGRFGQHTRNLFYPDWTPIKTGKGEAPPALIPPAKPISLPEMIRHAEILGQDTDFVRVDLYEVAGKVYFGELTHSPAAGGVDFEDPQLDLELGGYWSMPPSY
jgi:TupA-like ATPgrasp